MRKDEEVVELWREEDCVVEALVLEMLLPALLEALMLETAAGMVGLGRGQGVRMRGGSSSKWATASAILPRR